MKVLIKILREGAGRLIVLGDCILRPTQVKRSAEKQKILDDKSQHLILYQFYACPFCVKVRRSIKRLNLNIKTLSISEGSPYREVLLKGGGKIQVPCLYVKKEDGDEWLYESDKIIQWLEVFALDK